MRNERKPDWLRLAAIADRLGKSPAWGRDLRSRETRFPKPNAEGRYHLGSVLALIDARRCEKMTDLDFDAERRTLAEKILNTGKRKAVRKFCQEILAGKRNGMRAEYIRDCLETVEKGTP